jgi:hypothetical protein
MIQICAFKEKEKEKGEGKPQLGDKWKVSSLVANGRFQCLVVNGETYCLVAFGRRRNILFTSFHFPRNKFYFNFFSLI